MDRQRMRHYRKKRVLNVIKEKKLDGLILTQACNVRYLSDFGPMCLGPVGGDINERNAAVMNETGDFILLTTLDGFKYYQMSNTWIEDIRELRDFIDTCNYGPWAKDLLTAIKDQKLTKGKVGIDYMDFEACNFLKEKLPSIRFESIYKEMFEARGIKNEDEIELMKEALSVTETGYYAAEQNLRPGITERTLAGIASSAMYEAGAEYVHSVGIRSGRNTLKGAMWPSEDHFRYGDLVNMDIIAMVDGYCGDLHRVFKIGKPTDFQKDIYQAQLNGMFETLKQLKPGMTTKDVCTIFREIMAKSKLDQYTLPFGHGIGLKVLEVPFIGLHSEERKLQPGMVFCFEPRIGYFYGQEGNSFNVDLGIAEKLQGEIVCEEEILITETGAEIISVFPYGANFE